MHNVYKYLDQIKNFLFKHKIVLGIFCIPIIAILALIIHYESQMARQIENHSNELNQLTADALAVQERMYVGISDLYASKLELEHEFKSQIQVLVQAHETEKYELEQLLAHTEEERSRLQVYYWANSHINFTLGLHDFEAPLLVHNNSNMELINFFVAHFDALFSGDEERYRETIILNEWSEDFLMGFFSRYKEANYYRTQVKFVPSGEWGYRTVFILMQKYEDSEPALQAWPVLAVYRNGRWLVHDYH